MSSLKTFFKSKYILGPPKKNVSVVQHPSTSANISNLENFLYWHSKFQKSGGITLDLSQFWDTCWLIINMGQEWFQLKFKGSTWHLLLEKTFLKYSLHDDRTSLGKYSKKKKKSVKNFTHPPEIFLFPQVLKRSLHIWFEVIPLQTELLHAAFILVSIHWDLQVSKYFIRTKMEMKPCCMKLR